MCLFLFGCEHWFFLLLIPLLCTLLTLVGSPVIGIGSLQLLELVLHIW
jgi:hypothetical protein